MKKFRYILIVLIFLMLASCLSACNFIGGLFSNKLIEELDFEVATQNVSIGGEKVLYLTISPTDYTETVNFTSSSSSVASVEAVNAVGKIGVKIKGLSVGTSTVTAATTLSGLKATVTVTVSYADVTELTITQQGELSQTNVANITPIVFTAVPNATADPLAIFDWKVKNKATGTILSTARGKSISFTMPSDIGVTYVVTASFGQVSASVECGLFTNMREVVLSAESNTHILGEKSKFTLSWPSDCNTNPKIEWYVEINSDAQKITNETLSSINYVPTKYKEQTIFAVVDGIESNKITFSPSYNTVKQLTLSAEKDKYEVGKNIVIYLEYNLDYIDPQVDVTLEVYADGEGSSPTISYTRKASNFTTTQVNINYDTPGKKNVFVKLNGATATLSLSVENIVPAVDAIELSSQDIAGGKRISATVLPANANQKVKWYINDVLQPQDASFIDVLPTDNGEYHVMAKADNIQSVYQTVVKMTDESILPYTTIYHYYGGYEQNFYITSQQEMNNIVHYVFGTRKYDTVNKLNIYIDYDSSVNVGEKIHRACNHYVEAGVMPSYSNITNKYVGAVEIGFDFSNASPQAPTKSTSGSQALPQNASVKPTSYTKLSSPNTARTLFIENPSLPTMQVSTTNMLYKAIQWGYHPQITGDNAIAVNEVYIGAANVLKSIITDDMSEYEKVLAIYDWLCYEVTYDTDLLNMTISKPLGMSDGDYRSYELSEKLKYDGYYLEGVFADSSKRRAVCDGKSKAFVLLCGMEGITSVRVSGQLADGGGHAWNKVLIDADGDRIKEWYFVDSTWGDVLIETNEVLTHRYFLAADDEIPTHVEDENGYPDTINDYNYYSVNTFVYNDNVYDLVITSYSELYILFAYAKANGLTSVEFVYSYATPISTELGRARQATGYAISNTYYPFSDGVCIVYVA